MRFLKRMKYKIVLIILIILGLIWRLVPLVQNHSFWTDEDHVAVFSRAILERGKPVLTSGFDIGIYQLPQYWLGALGLKIFGENEVAIRWPSFVFGVLTIVAVYLLSERLFSKSVGLLAAFLTAFLKIEILWSNQARPYQAIQFFWLLGTYFSFKYLEDGRKKYLVWVVVCGLTASFFHPIGGFLLAALLFIYSLLALFRVEKRNLVLAIFVFFITTLPAFYFLLGQPMNTLFHFNNMFYYRVFLTHNYLSLVISSLIGFILMLMHKNVRHFLFLSMPLLFQMVVISFLSPQPFTRYFYPAFTFLIILASYGVIETGNLILDIRKNTKIQYLISGIIVFLLIFSLWRTGKLSLSPRKVYSLNADMQEIPEVDWKKLFFLVGQKLAKDPDLVLVTNWMDTPVWFLGEGALDYVIRKEPEEVDVFSGAKKFNTLEKFMTLIRQEKKGIVVLDSWDTEVPDGVREYCRDNLTKELEIDRLYPVQPRYWPVMVYSWGID